MHTPTMLKFVLIASCFIYFTRNCSCYKKEEVDYYEELIVSEREKAKNYKLPNNADRYKSNNEGPPTDFGSFDFIIVGSGSTGSVVASRLSEENDWNILVLEAGEFGNNFTDITKMGYEVNIFSDYNWGYYSTRQKNCCLGMEKEQCPYPRGKGVGGTSLLNALLYVRGNAKDFDKWCALGNPGWCYKDVLPYFKKSEDFHKTDPDVVVDDGYHGKGGLLSVVYPLPRSEQCNVFLKANEELGYNSTDVNGHEQIGSTQYQINTKYGKRQDSGTAFLKPFLRRKNLKILTNSFVTKIIINDAKEAEGVIFTHKGRLYRAKVDKEVILSAGSINSPQLLMLSGIGPENHLISHGIPVIKNLEVGSVVLDHLQVYGLTFSSNLSEPVKPLRELVKDYLNGYGLLTEALSQQCTSYVQTKLENTPKYPDLEIDFFSSNSTSDALTRSLRWKKEVSEAISGVNSESSFAIYLAVLNTKSQGSVRLKSSSPLDYPLVDSNCFSDPEGEDLLRTYESVQMALHLLETEPFKKINAKLESKPLKFCSEHTFLTKDYWLCALRYLTGHDNHPSTSCKMGPDPKKGAVVDAKLRVHGIKKLRVADASVIPVVTAAHINAICYMIGEKLAEMLKKEYGKL